MSGDALTLCLVALTIRVRISIGFAAFITPGSHSDSNLMTHNTGVKSPLSRFHNLTLLTLSPYSFMSGKVDCILKKITTLEYLDKYVSNILGQSKY